MKKVFIIHGFGGQPNGGWRPWLMSELDKRDVYAFALAMPTPRTPNVKEWMDEISRCVDRNIEDEIYLVGHSLGSAAILNYLESTDSKIAGAVLVSGRCVNPTREETIGFYRGKESTFDFEKIKTKAEKFLVIHGDNDDKVPFENAEVMSKVLGCELIVIKNGGHLGGKDGFDKLPEVLEGLMGIMR